MEVLNQLPVYWKFLEDRKIHCEKELRFIGKIILSLLENHLACGSRGMIHTEKELGVYPPPASQLCRPIRAETSVCKVPS